MALRELLVIFGVEMDKKSEKKVKDSFGAMKKFAVGAVTAITAGFAARATKELLDMASEVTETRNQLGATFGDLAGDVEGFTNAVAKEVGRSQLDMLKFASATGAIIKPMIGSAEGAAEMSKSFAQLAVDLGSFFNAADEDALRALQSGIVGQSEPLLKFGIALTQASLAEFALSKGIRKSIKDMNQAEKVQLRYQFIMEKTRDAQGDAAKTAASYANASKGLVAAIKDLAVSIGQKMLPAAEEFIAWAIQFTRDVGPDLLSIVDGVGSAFQFFFRIVKLIFRPTSLLTLVIAALTIKLFAMGKAAKKAGNLSVEGARKSAAAWTKTRGKALMTFGLLGILGAATAAIAEDIEVWQEGGDSFIGTMLDGFTDLVIEIGSVPGAIFEMLATATEHWDKALGEWLDLGTTFSEKLKEQFFGIFAGLFGGEEEAGPGGPAVQRGKKSFAAIAGGGFAGGGIGFGAAIRAAREAEAAQAKLAAMHPEKFMSAPQQTILSTVQNDVNVSVDASGVGSPGEVKTAVQSGVGAAMEDSYRQAQASFEVSGG